MFLLREECNEINHEISNPRAFSQLLYSDQHITFPSEHLHMIEQCGKATSFHDTKAAPVLNDTADE